MKTKIFYLTAIMLTFSGLISCEKEALSDADEVTSAFFVNKKVVDIEPQDSNTSAKENPDILSTKACSGGGGPDGTSFIQIIPEARESGVDQILGEKTITRKGLKLQE